MKALFALAPGIRLVLASTSPRRRQFLEEWGLPFVPVRPENAEPRPKPGENPQQYTMRAAEAKALAVASHPTHADALVLAADTVVALEGDILGKPRDQAEALSMLARLSGRGHDVISAVCLVLPARAAACRACIWAGGGAAAHRRCRRRSADANRI